MGNFIVIDTEAVGKGKDCKVYDVGIVVANRKGEILDKFSFVNNDVFTNTELMQTAYYYSKVPCYLEDINRIFSFANWRYITETFRNVVMDYKVKDIWAYNCAYDRTALNTTTQYYSKGWKSYFCPYGTKWRDIWDYAGATICNTQKYVKWCLENNLTTANDNPLTNVDTLGKYIRNDLSYQEEHMAIFDAEDETDILLAAMRRKQKVKSTEGEGWKQAAAIAKKLKEKAC